MRRKKTPGTTRFATIHFPGERLDESTPEYTWRALCGEIVPGTRISLGGDGPLTCRACRAERDRQREILVPPAEVTVSHVVQYIPYGGQNWVDADFGEREGYDSPAGAYDCITGNKASWAGWEGSRFGRTAPKAYRVVRREISDTVLPDPETVLREVTDPTLYFQLSDFLSAVRRQDPETGGENA